MIYTRYTLKDFRTEIENKELVFHHGATCRGYVSRRIGQDDFPVEKYEGKFGRGIKVYLPNYENTNYCNIVYYIRKEDMKSDHPRKSGRGRIYSAQHDDQFQDGSRKAQK